MSSVGDDLGDDYCMYHGMVVEIDRCVYGTPHDSKCIVKCGDLINAFTSFVGEEADEDLRFRKGSALARRDGGVLKINATDNSHCCDGNIVEVGPMWMERCYLGD